MGQWPRMGDNNLDPHPFLQNLESAELVKQAGGWGRDEAEGHTASALAPGCCGFPFLHWMQLTLPSLGRAPVAAVPGNRMQVKHSHASWLPSGSAMLCICKTTFIPEH